MTDKAQPTDRNHGRLTRIGCHGSQTVDPTSFEAGWVTGDLSAILAASCLVCAGLGRPRPPLTLCCCIQGARLTLQSQVSRAQPQPWDGCLTAQQSRAQYSY